MDFNTSAGPDFICIGMPKAGTGWLYDQLRYHPDFWIPPVKELAYLKNDSSRVKRNVSRRLERLEAGAKKNVEKMQKLANRRSGDTRDIEFLREVSAAKGEPLDINRYATLFRFKENAMSGDVTPGYAALSAGTIASLAEVLPTTKIVLLVRDPVDRVWSRICMWYRNGKFDGALLTDLKEFRRFLTSEHVERESFPTKVVQRWKENAPLLPFKTFLFDEIVAAPEVARGKILGYLGADPAKVSGHLAAGHNKKASADKLELTPEIKDVLIEHFHDELLACAEFFGNSAADWKTRHGI